MLSVAGPGTIHPCSIHAVDYIVLERLIPSAFGFVATGGCYHSSNRSNRSSQPSDSLHSQRGNDRVRAFVKLKFQSKWEIAAQSSGLRSLRRHRQKLEVVAITIVAA